MKENQGTLDINYFKKDRKQHLSKNENLQKEKLVRVQTGQHLLQLACEINMKRRRNMMKRIKKRTKNREIIFCNKKQNGETT